MRPDERVSAQLVARALALRAAHELRGAVFPAHRLHVSLVGLGVYVGRPEGVLARARTVAEAVRVPRSWRGSSGR